MRKSDSTVLHKTWDSQHKLFINPLPCDGLDLYFCALHAYVLCLLYEDFNMFVYVARYHMFLTFTITCSPLLFTVNLSDDAALLVGWCYKEVTEEKVSENKRVTFLWKEFDREWKLRTALYRLHDIPIYNYELSFSTSRILAFCHETHWFGHETDRQQN